MLDPAFQRPIAHRGLYSQKAGVIENSQAAFFAAIEAGYGIECDLQPAQDGEPMVFHDRGLDRLVEGRFAEGNREITNYTGRALRKLKYKGTGGSILRLGELFDLAGGQVPLMIEIKSEWRLDNPLFYKRIARLAKSYKGPVALKSFDPEVMVLMRDLAPKTARGLISGAFRGARWSDEVARLSPKERFGLRHLLAGAVVSPSFISYDINSLPAVAPMLLKDRFGLPLFSWTVRSKVDFAKARALGAWPIFEGAEAESEAAKVLAKSP